MKGLRFRITDDCTAEDFIRQILLKRARTEAESQRTNPLVYRINETVPQTISQMVKSKDY